MLISCVPILVVLYGALSGSEKVTPYAWLGILTSMVGVAFTSGVLENGVTLNEGTVMIFGAALCAAIQTLLSKHLTRRYAAIDVTTWAIWLGTLGLLPFSHDLLGGRERERPELAGDVGLVEHRVGADALAVRTVGGFGRAERQATGRGEADGGDGQPGKGLAAIEAGLRGGRFGGHGRRLRGCPCASRR